MSVVNDGKEQLWAKEFGVGALSDVPKAFIDMFSDISWHNDAMPQFTLQQGKNCLLLGIRTNGCEDPNLDGAKRYTVQLCQQDDSGEITFDVVPLLIAETDDWEVLIEKLSLFIDFDDD